MAKIVRVAISALLLLSMTTVLVSSPLVEAGAAPALTISKEEPGKVEMADGDGKKTKKNLNDGDIVRICNNLHEGDIVLTIRDRNGVQTHQQTIPSGQCVDFVVGSAQLPGGGTKYSVKGGSFINIFGCTGLQLPNEFFLGDCLAIGGEILSLDSTALLVAGFQANLTWMIPVVVSGIGIGMFLVKRK